MWSLIICSSIEIASRLKKCCILRSILIARILSHKKLYKPKKISSYV
uniref:Uncharacterized protein n=1 Tax=Arundo donax TaxID=35708 RepID=A0A0A9DY63_ARUDO